MRHKNIASLREFLKGYSACDDKPRPTDQQERLPMPPMAVCRGGETMELPERDATPFSVLLENQRSRRSYGNGPLTLEELSFLLWAAQGVESVGEHRTLRTAPTQIGKAPL